MYLETISPSCHPAQHNILSTYLRLFFPLSLSLTAECAVPPADLDSSAITGLGVSLNVVAQSRQHAIIFAHVIDTVPQKGFRRNERVTGLEEIRQDRSCALWLEDFFLILVTVGFVFRSWIRFAAANGGTRTGWIQQKNEKSEIFHHDALNSYASLVHL